MYAIVILRMTLINEKTTKVAGPMKIQCLELENRHSETISHKGT